MAVGLSKVPSYPGHPLTQTIFSLCSPLNDCRRIARSLFKIDLSSLFSCFSFARPLILLLLLISGNVHTDPCPVFCLFSVRWKCDLAGRSVQYCTCSNWVHLKCSLLSFSRFRTLGSSHSWSCSPCFFGGNTPISTVTSSPGSPAGIPPLLNLAHLAQFC